MNWKMRFRTLLVVIAIALLMQPTAALAGPNEDANRLFVEAVQLYRKANTAPEDDRYELYAKVKENINRIIEDNPSSDLAVKIMLGEPLGPIKLRKLDALLQKYRPDVLAAKRAREREIVSILSNSKLEYPAIVFQEDPPFGPTPKKTVWLSFTSYNASKRSVTGLIWMDGESEPATFTGELKSLDELMLMGDKNLSRYLTRDVRMGARHEYWRLQRGENGVWTTWREYSLILSNMTVDFNRPRDTAPREEAAELRRQSVVNLQREQEVENALGCPGKQNSQLIKRGKPFRLWKRSQCNLIFARAKTAHATFLVTPVHGDEFTQSETITWHPPEQAPAFQRRLSLRTLRFLEFKLAADSRDGWVFYWHEKK